MNHAFDDEGAGSFLSGFGMLGLTSMVQTTGIDLVSGGLDALEFIGKKTMDVLAEGDPGLRHKREKLTGKGPSLSQVINYCSTFKFKSALKWTWTVAESILLGFHRNSLSTVMELWLVVSLNE